MKPEERQLQERIENYINNKINWSANKNTVIQAERGDVEQFAQDTFWEAWQQAKDHFKQQNQRIENLIPIPLTEKRLLEFGFEKLSIGDGNEYLININGLGYSINLKTYSVGLDYLEYEGICKIEYVHELQNFHYILCKKEL